MCGMPGVCVSKCHTGGHIRGATVSTSTGCGDGQGQRTGKKKCLQQFLCFMLVLAFTSEQFGVSLVGWLVDI